MQKTKFSPTPTQVRAAFDVFRSMAWEATIRPIVEGYQRKILAEMQAPPSPKWQGRCKPEESIITDPKHTYLLSDEDAQEFYRRCNEEQHKAGLVTEKPEYCPLCVAEHLVTKAEQVLVDVMESVTGLTTDELLCAGMDTYKEFIALTLRLLAPFMPADVDANVNVNVN